MKTVLFVCFHNAGRSQMAEAMVNTFAKDRNIDVRAISAGTINAKLINPIAIQAMDEIGISMAGQKPKQIMQWHVDRADKIITMHCGVDPENCPKRFLGNSIDWGIDDPAGQPIEKVRIIRDQIAVKVSALLSEFKTGNQESRESNHLH